MLSRSAPYQAIRTIYGELLKQLFWGYSLRSMWEKNDEQNDFYITCYNTLVRLLEKKDAVQFSKKLEELMLHEYRLTIFRLTQLGIDEAQKLLIPDLK